MKVLFLANNDAGLYKFRKELIEEIAKKNDVFLCLPYGKYIPQLIRMGGKYIPCKLECHGMNIIKEINLLNFYRKTLKKVNPDIVFTYTIKPNIYGGIVCSSMKIPYVVNITGLGSAVENAGVLQKITLFLYKYSLRKAQKVFFQNIENRNFMLKQKVTTGSYGLLPGSGVNLKQYQVLDYPHKQVIEFVFVARIMKEKGIEQYLEAAEYITRKYSNTRFHICGDILEVEYEKKINDFQERGIVIYHGAVENMEDIYKISHCVIHPTYYPEGLSNVLLESCASGRPIITTNRSGCREVLDDGRNGFVVKQKDGKDLVRVIEKFLALSWEEKREMGLLGRKKVESKFDRQIVIKKYVEEMNCVRERKKIK